MNFMKLIIKISPIFLIVFLSFTVSFAQNQQKEKLVRASSSFRGEFFSYKLTDLDFTETPSWKPGETDPPLSVRRAVEIARINLPRFVKEAEKWRIRKIDLNNIIDDKWFYTIFFTCSDVKCGENQEREFMSIVKMDGTIIEPKRFFEQ